MLYNIDHILDDIIQHVDTKTPFSLVRLGDGDLKLLKSLIRGKPNEVKFDRSGIPYDKVDWLLNIYKDSCNNANYTSSFSVYSSKRFWNRASSKGTGKLIENWKSIYEKVGIVNDNFCNPEIGHLLFLNDINFLEKIKDKKICLITCYRTILNQMKKRKFDVSLIVIPGIGRGHYYKYKDIIRKIRKRSDNTDIFLVGAGALGKSYLDLIKKSGSVAIDIGQVMNVWNGGKIPDRFNNILKYNKKTKLFELTNKVIMYKEHI